MKNIFTAVFFSLLLLFLWGCNSKAKKEEKPAIVETSYSTTGSIERLDPLFDDIVDSHAQIEVIGEGFDWTEGPVWVEEGGYLLFSDIPKNSIYKWKVNEGTSLYLKPSGYTGAVPRGGELGSNALLIDSDGKLVLCQHGDRRLAKMLSPLSAPEANFETLVADHDGKRFNSPNDAVFSTGNAVYFTDPPYGLEQQAEDPSREIPFQGVYRLANGKADLLTDSLSRPNGIALSPDEKRLYVANSDPEKAIWMIYELDENGLIKEGSIFYDATENAKHEKGLPDGMKVDSKGNIFATGPGGVWVFNPEGKVLGKIKTGQATSNCAFSQDGKWLFMTADDFIMRIALKS
ncbi:SMP-30/gluconolactonase/LRE family protein [Leptobacterium flavescens]|uniref:SMP-30/gluconolactonase/LRE family protein n=1 Tax=Leptobacterium flavescens TaxID=472055 RepID=A0A6P0UK98_9FLAO|nr:SMP-30/gluconolactonase/LRE family protein [Leptobacterium flavescens]NER13725.1 SMP-30/gluconolactonase/LRE family protein [Leptobacterium flavescens]